MSELVDLLEVVKGCTGAGRLGEQIERLIVVLADRRERRIDIVLRFWIAKLARTFGRLRMGTPVAAARRRSTFMCSGV